MRITSVSHAVFAATLIGLGVEGLVQGDFAAIWQPVPKSLPARETWVYVCALVSLGTGVGLFIERAAVLAARVLLGYLLLWLLLNKAPVVLHAPAVAVSYESAGETVVIVAGAWVLYAWFAGAWDRQNLGFATGETGLRIARVLYGLAMIAFGIAHFAYGKDTASLVPSYLPSHLVFAYLTGGAYLAAGAALLVGVYARWAAALSALQMGLFTLLVWAPQVAAGSRDPSVLSETVLSWALTASAWVVADSFRYQARSGRGANSRSAAVK
jgi:uncharacterized membrane protein